MPKADEAVQNALFYQVWNWSLQVRAKQVCKANRKVWAATLTTNKRKNEMMTLWYTPHYTSGLRGT